MTCPFPSPYLLHDDGRLQVRKKGYPHGEVENNSMWRAAREPQDIVGQSPILPQIPAEARLSPRRRRGAPPGNRRALKPGAYSDQGRAHRAEADALITRAENPIVRVNMAASVRRALRAPTMARRVLRAPKTRRSGRMADGERRLSQEPLSLFSIPYSLLPVHCSTFAHLISSAPPARPRHDSNVRTRLSRRSSFSALMSAGPVPVHARQRLWPRRRHTLVWSPFGDVSTQAGVNA